ncbi:MAG: transglutaminase-like domain-containing protein [Acidobacteriota bacterium]
MKIILKARRALPYLLAACMFLPWTGGAEPASQTLPGPRSRTFEMTYKSTLPVLPAGSSRGYLWIPVPPNTPYQTITGLRIVAASPYEQVSEMKYGNRAYRFPLAARKDSVVMTFRVTRSEHIHRPGLPPALPHGNGSSHIPAEDPTVWLHADQRVPLDATIRQWARRTVAGRRTDAAKAKAIFDYAVDNLIYDKSGSGWGKGDIYWACDAKRGNCTDFHALFTGFSRAVGIPARFEIGFPVPAERPRGRIAGYHCWAEFYLPGEGWIPVDVSEAQKHPHRRAYFFGAHDAHRVLFTVGRDLTFPAMKGEPLNFFVYPYAEGDGHPLGKVAWELTYREAPEQPSLARSHAGAAAGEVGTKAAGEEAPRP